MACSITVTSDSSNGSNCTSSVTTLVDEIPVPTISLDAVVGGGRQHRGTVGGDDIDVVDFGVVNEFADDLIEAVRVPRLGHDRKKKASYRSDRLYTASIR